MDSGFRRSDGRRGLWHENGLQDPSGGQFGFFVTPISANKPNNPTRHCGESRNPVGAFERDGALLWTPAFAGVTADGADGVCLFRVLTIRQCPPAWLQNPNCPPDSHCRAFSCHKPCGMRHSGFGLTAEAGITPLSRQGEGEIHGCGCS